VTTAVQKAGLDESEVKEVLHVGRLQEMKPFFSLPVRTNGKTCQDFRLLALSDWETFQPLTEQIYPFL